MQDIIDKYIKSKFGDIEIPVEEEDKVKLARTLLGFSIVQNLDYWLDISRDYLDNSKPGKPFLRDNDFSRKDKMFRESLSKLDPKTKEVVQRLVNSTVTGFLFSLLTSFDQFDFGKIMLTFEPKSTHKAEILISSQVDDLHDELSEWIFSFSKFKDNLVEKTEHNGGYSIGFK